MPSVPEIKALGGIELEKQHTYVPGEEVVLMITSKSGITKFDVDIESPSLTPEELQGVGLASHLDLVDPGELLEPLQGLGLLEGDSVKGLKEVKFDISGFMPLLAALGDGVHSFKLTVANEENGEKVGTLIIEIKN